MPTKNTLA